MISSHAAVVYYKALNFPIQHVFARKSLKKFLQVIMVYILAAFFVHHAIDALSPEKQSKYKQNIYSISGLSLNPYTTNSRKLMQTLLTNVLEDKTEIFV